MFGTFHYSDGGSTSWRKFAETIFAQAGDWAKIRAQVVPIPSSDYPTSARRPHYSVLDCHKIAAIYGIPQENWRDNLATDAFKRCETDGDTNMKGIILAGGIGHTASSPDPGHQQATASRSTTSR